ncbi:hypothetical protein JW935_28060 [candidate division KSB1 bacterium]|nr:hypothetical protein [candidate division KSB1 bacterium]
MIFRLSILVCLFFINSICSRIYAQPAIAGVDSVSAKTEADSTADDQHYKYEEFILETIRIEAVIERPSVTLIPKKAETQVGEINLERRSFLNELNAKPKEFSDYHEKLETGKRIKKIKKVLAKEK